MPQAAAQEGLSMPAEQASRPGNSWTTVLDGQQLRQLRTQRGLSREELADLAGISLTTGSRLESQPRASCRSRTLALLAAALGEQPTAITPPVSV
jgi:DNA-binding XRE family transcriptional regulator